MTDLDAAWAAVHDATPPDWFVGQPSYHDERHEWTQYAFDRRKPAKVGVGAGSGRPSARPRSRSSWR